jgi:hypothetical protein
MSFRSGKSLNTLDCSRPVTARVSSWMKCSEYDSRAGGRHPAEWISAGTPSSHSASQTGYQKRSPRAGGCCSPSYGSGLIIAPTKPYSVTQRRNSPVHAAGEVSIVCGSPAMPLNRGSTSHDRAIAWFVSSANHCTIFPGDSLCIS